MKSVILIFAFCCFCGIQMLQAQSNFVFIKVHYSATGSWNQMTVVDPFDNIEEIDLEKWTKTESIGPNAITIRNEIEKWEKQGYSKWSVVSFPTGYEIWLRKKE